MNALTPIAATRPAPGGPGMAPSWSDSRKDWAGGSLGPARLWFTLGGGIVTEVYFPRIDIPQIRDLGFIVADDAGFWVEVKGLGNYTVSQPEPGVSAITLEHRHPRFTLRLRVVPDPSRDVLLVEVNLDGDPGLRPYALLAPHLGGTGHDNVAAVGHYRGRTILWAEQGPFGLALAAVDETQEPAWGAASAGYVGENDGWQLFNRHGTLARCYTEAGPGNVALTGALPRCAVLALGFGSSRESAATLALSAVCRPFEEVWREQCRAWQRWHRLRTRRAVPRDLPAPLARQFFTSAAVLQAHQDKTYPGAMVASLSVPWGEVGEERGGYHLVWPRDLVECAGALLALGDDAAARNILRYLLATQHGDGHWYQNQWLGGKPYWEGLQLDEAAFPVLLAATLEERGALDGIAVGGMIRRALGFILRTGPSSEQDRWEEDAGLNAFTLAVCIAALVAGAPYLDPTERETALAVADFWNARIESWTSVRDTPLARRVGVAGYYVREAPPDVLADRAALSDTLPILNRRRDPSLPASEQVSTDFLQLVRFGLRRAEDPLVRDTLKVVDALLRVETPAGPSWHRYNGDGYGEHRDGTPFDGTGRGRAWPLLTGERGHYAVAAGENPLPYLEAMAEMGSALGMLPEQVWDGESLNGFQPGRPTGSAMPLAWTHAEFIKLAVSLQLGRPFDRPTALWERYRGRCRAAPLAIWSPWAATSRLAAGTPLLLLLPAPAVVRWGVNEWDGVTETATEPCGFGLHRALLRTGALAPGERVVFTWRLASSGWTGEDHAMVVEKAPETPDRGADMG